mmetsp:Transcript_31041/g.84167  ORF Transcript_31041/g.84167 Transcript_31041/m.84167 type:complete len:287 (+) Transcript_31041:498-1358(+)
MTGLGTDIGCPQLRHGVLGGSRYVREVHGHVDGKRPVAGSIEVDKRHQVDGQDPLVSSQWLAQRSYLQVLRAQPADGGNLARRVHELQACDVQAKASKRAYALARRRGQGVDEGPPRLGWYHLAIVQCPWPQECQIAMVADNLHVSQSSRSCEERLDRERDGGRGVRRVQEAGQGGQGDRPHHREGRRHCSHGLGLQPLKRSACYEPVHVIGQRRKEPNDVDGQQGYGQQRPGEEEAAFSPQHAPLHAHGDLRWRRRFHYDGHRVPVLPPLLVETALAVRACYSDV